LCDAVKNMTHPSTAVALEIVRDGADASPLLGGLMVEWPKSFGRRY
jgi:hypothetical protein